MKITIFGPSARFLSGITYYTIRLSNVLSNHCDVTAVLFRHMLPQKLFPGRKRVGAQLSHLSFTDTVKSMEILDWYNPISWLTGYRTARKGDIIIFEWWTSSVAFMYYFIAFLNLKRVPIIIEYHEVVDPLEHSNLLLRLYSQSIGLLLRRLASHFIAHSEADKELIMRTYRIDGKRIDVIPHGLYDQYQKIDRSFARARLDIPERYVILFFGLLRPYKGLKYLIRAFEELPPEILAESRLLIVGEAWEDAESISMAEISPQNKKISIINRYISDEEIPQFFSAADVLVLPYIRASQSGVAHIGMAYGLPIIASSVGGLSESLGMYQGAFLIPAKNTEKLKQGLIRFFDHDLVYPPPKDLEWDIIGAKWMEFFTKICRY